MKKKQSRRSRGVVVASKSRHRAYRRWVVLRYCHEVQDK